MNKFINSVFFLAVLAGIWTIYWSTKAYMTPSTLGNENGFCIVVEPAFDKKIKENPQIVLGEQLFRNNCSACHMINRQLIGPPLEGIAKKYATNKEWLYEWVRNSPALIEEGDPIAIQLFEDYQRIPMTPFPLLTNEEIDAILAFVDAYNSVVPISITRP